MSRCPPLHSTAQPYRSLMERAARTFVETVMERKLDLSNVCVVCGSGNNGGDGFAIARLLLEKGGCVTAVMAGTRTTVQRRRCGRWSFSERPEDGRKLF